MIGCFSGSYFTKQKQGDGKKVTEGGKKGEFSILLQKVPFRILQGCF